VAVLAFALGGSSVFAGPGDTGNGTIPPGFTKVTFVHDTGGPPKVIVERGPGGSNGKGLASGEATVCSDLGTNGTDLCDSFTWDGQYWPGAAVTYNVNLKNSGDDGDFLAAFQASAQTWEDDAGSVFDFTFGGITGRKASSLRNRLDGNNDITWAALNKYQNPIAVAIFWFFTATGEVVETDLINNSNFPWAAPSFVGASHDLLPVRGACQGTARHLAVTFSPTPQEPADGERVSVVLATSLTLSGDHAMGTPSPHFHKGSMSS
jgi:hypothetical protein